MARQKMICDLCKDDIFPEDPIFCDRCYIKLKELLEYTAKQYNVALLLLETLQNREHYS